MDGVALLSHDHRVLEGLIRDYEIALSDAQRREAVAILVKALSRHVALDELIVYPLAGGVLSHGDEAVAAPVQHSADIWRTLSALHTAANEKPPSHETIDRLMTRIREQLRQHVDLDESELLPRIGDQLDDDALAEFGLVLEQGRHFASTRPRSAHAQSRQDLAPPVAAAFDRLRDRLTG